MDLRASVQSQRARREEYNSNSYLSNSQKYHLSKSAYKLTGCQAPHPLSLLSFCLLFSWFLNSFQVSFFRNVDPHSPRVLSFLKVSQASQTGKTEECASSHVLENPLYAAHNHQQSGLSVTLAWLISAIRIMMMPWGHQYYCILLLRSRYKTLQSRHGDNILLQISAP